MTNPWVIGFVLFLAFIFRMQPLVMEGDRFDWRRPWWEAIRFAGVVVAIVIVGFAGTIVQNIFYPTGQFP